MDDVQFSQPSPTTADSNTEPNTDTDLGTNGEESVDVGVGAGKIFDISEDNISPVDTTAEEAQKNPMATPDEQKAALEALEKQEPIKKKMEISLDDELAGIPSANNKVPLKTPMPVPPRPVTPVVPTPMPPVAPIVPRPNLIPSPTRSVPENLPGSTPIAQRSEPASPPTKIVDSAYSLNSQAPSSKLQDAMNAILPTRIGDTTAPSGSVSMRPPVLPVIPSVPPNSFSRIADSAMPHAIGEDSIDAALPTSAPSAAGRIPGAVHDTIIKPLRTYEGDVAEILSRRQNVTTMGTPASAPSLAAIAIAENERQTGEKSIGMSPEPKQPSGAGRKIFALLVSLIFIGAGVIGAFYLYSKSALAPFGQAPLPQQETVQSIIPSDDRTVINIDNLSSTEVLARISAELQQSQTPGTIREIVLAKNVAGVFAQVGATDMISMFHIPAPDILTRSLLPPWMLGIYADPNGNKSVFVAVRNNFFQNAFAGMLQWEKVMPDDLRQFLSPGDVHGIANVSQTSTPSVIVTPLPVATRTATSTATSTVIATSTKSTAASTSPASNISVPIQPYLTVRGHFEDGIIHNKDVRIFKTDSGNTLFLYSFVDNATLVFAQNEAALAEITARLEKLENFR